MKLGTLLISAVALLGITLSAESARAACTPATVAATDIPTWKPPTKSTSACTQTDATAFEAAVNDPNGTQDTLDASVTGACKTCLISETSTGSNWQLFVWTDRANNLGFFNPSACIAAAGGSNACAGAYYGADSCTSSSCSTCTDEASYGTCAQSSQTTTCKTYATSAASSCDATSNAAFSACGLDATASIATMVMHVCGGAAGAAPTTPGDTSTGGSGTGSQTGGGSSSSGGGTGNGTGSNKGNGNSGNSSGASHVNFNDPPQTGGCSTSSTGSTNGASGSLLAIAVCALVIATKRRRSPR
jgi:hypothetical protein